MTASDVARGGYYEFTRTPMPIPDVAKHTRQADDLYRTSLSLAGFTTDPLPGNSSAR